MTLYFIIFGNLIGSRIGEMHGFTYMQFIVPGLIMMAVITNAYANVASSFFSAKFQRNIEELFGGTRADACDYRRVRGRRRSARSVRGITGDGDFAVLRPVPGPLMAICRADAASDGNPVLAGRSAERGICQNV